MHFSDSDHAGNAQQFAQVTNPPIDPLREAVVMSLGVELGREGSIFKEQSYLGQRIGLSSPVLSPRKYYALKNNEYSEFPVQKFDLNYDPQTESLKQQNIFIRLRNKDA